MSSGVTTPLVPFDEHGRPAEGNALAPFRMLVLADPQIEGDSSLSAGWGKRWEGHLGKFSGGGSDDEKEGGNRGGGYKWRMVVVGQVLKEVLVKDVPEMILRARKVVDLWGNDWYLAHIYRTMHWWARPSHVTVLGDLIGSQWVGEEEFEERGRRYWGRVMRGGERVEDDVTDCGGGVEEERKERVFGLGDGCWERSVVNVAGNHDIGYAGDVTRERMERFERVFGRANWDVRFEYPKGLVEGENVPSLHMVVLNSLVLDTPALDEEVQKETYGYMNDVIGQRLRPVEDSTSFTLLLTHLPLFKKEGVCVDGPKFEFWGNDDGGGHYRPRGLKEQNHLSRHASEPGILESIYGFKGDVAAAAQGKGRVGLILNGHDHEGCDTWHYIPSNRTWNSSETLAPNKKTKWEVTRWHDADQDISHTGVREVTVRSMMGDFAGNAGLLSAWFDFEERRWKYDMQMCRLGTQHIWWAVHILDLITAGLVIGIFALKLASPSRSEDVRIKPRSNGAVSMAKKKS